MLLNPKEVGRLKLDHSLRRGILAYIVHVDEVLHQQLFELHDTLVDTIRTAVSN